MKRIDLIRHRVRPVPRKWQPLCVSHPKTRKSSTVPRHRELNEFLARKICRDLEIPMP